MAPTAAAKRMPDRRGSRPPPDGNLQWLSKRLTFILRHGAAKVGLSVDKCGWVNVADMLQLKDFKGVQLPQLKSVVRDCPKQRFELKDPLADGEPVKIRATQGHSLTQVSDEMHRPILTVADIGQEQVVHGTYLEAWNKIRREGLNSMGRNHVHLCLGLPGSGVISGMRSNATVAVFVDLASMLSSGVEVVQSPNGVVLTAGDGRSGVLSTRHFKTAVWLGPPRTVLWERGADRTSDACREVPQLFRALTESYGVSPDEFLVKAQQQPQQHHPPQQEDGRGQTSSSAPPARGRRWASQPPPQAAPAAPQHVETRAELLPGLAPQWTEAPALPALPPPDPAAWAAATAPRTEAPALPALPPPALPPPDPAAWAAATAPRMEAAALAPAFRPPVAYTSGRGPTRAELDAPPGHGCGRPWREPTRAEVEAPPGQGCGLAWREPTRAEVEAPPGDRGGACRTFFPTATAPLLAPSSPPPLPRAAFPCRLPAPLLPGPMLHSAGAAPLARSFGVRPSARRQGPRPPTSCFFRDVEPQRSGPLPRDR
ncbi:unnamed protein product, partial [Prorocentrum cordatum]